MRVCAGCANRNEATACFDGKRTVEEAAERIQNRVTLYLSEIE